VALSEEQLTTLINSGKDDISNEDYGTAEMKFEQVIKEAPLFPSAYLNCATVQFFQSKNKEALVNLDIAIALLPPKEVLDVSAAYHNRALVNVELGNIDEAIIDLKAAMALSFEASEEELQRVSELKSDNSLNTPEKVIGKVQSLCALGKQKFAENTLEALALFKKAADISPTSIDAVYGVAVSNSALGRVDETLEHFNQLLGMLKPEHDSVKAEALYNRSAILKEKGDVKQAIADLEECLSLSLDETVGFPVLGSAEREAEMVASIQSELDEWKSAATLH